ncbi:two-component system response regulator [Silvimonas iriomotensis]|uniref:GGDEF domain-containing protein n=1 Tax=Silvimonas iriomotensis TaxID=449662 RepID=A0ABQ2P6L0_9NEIS|nr:EAL domain-containing protein [Silvimonas iriomotensis]GGP19492.1 GGDEF domain-containing protein [Silvimonas iriomotensis]
MFAVEEQWPRPTILIVDDAIENIKLISHALYGMADLLFATNGPDALRIADSSRPDLVILDIEMPGMDGYEVCNALKANPYTSECAVIFITAHEGTSYETQSLAAGGIDFLTKPINVPICRLRVQNQLTLKRQKDELAQTRRDLADLVHHLPSFVAFWGADTVNRYCNDQLGHWFGISAARMLGMSLDSVLNEETMAQLRPHWVGAMEGRTISVEVTLFPSSARRRIAQTTLVPNWQMGVVAGVLMVLTDITDRITAERALWEEKERMRITLNSIGDAVIATDQQGLVTFMNPIAEEMTGWYSSDAIGKPIDNVMELRDANNGHVLRNPIYLALKEERIVGMALNCNLVALSGQQSAVEDSAAPIRNQSGEISGAIIVFRDASEARAMAIKMSYLASHDPLTGLPNRLLLQDRISHGLQVARWSQTHVAMLLLDLDYFKFVNDSIGYTAGDDLLRQVAHRLENELSATGTIGRLGGDEFVVLLPELRSITEADEVATSLLAAMAEPFELDGNRFDLSISVGISLFPDDSSDEETLMRHADVAMHRAKQDGRNRYRFFSTELEDLVLSRHLLERHLREALQENRFEVFYQSKVNAREGRVIGAEALVRMYSTEGELLSPGRFIPLAEETGLIVPLGKMVLEIACRQAASWHEQGHALKMSVNIAAAQFAAGNFPEVVAEVLDHTGLNPDMLELEITEGTLMSEADAARETLIELKALGVHVSLDDFGTGYSSLAYLKRFPLDTLKIDQSFVRDMLNDKSDMAIIQTIIALGQTLGMELVAEGVEQREQAEILASMGCHIMQGYLYDKPKPASDWSFIEPTGVARSISGN